MSTRLVKVRHVQRLSEDFKEKAYDQEAAAVSLEEDEQWEMAAFARVRAQVYQTCAEQTAKIEEYTP